MTQLQEDNLILAWRYGMINFMQLMECMRTNSPPVVLGGVE